MKSTRVLIVDDSSTVRMILRRYLGDAPNVEVAGAASNGRQAIDRLDDYQPDVILLDVEMPEMDGLETLTELRKLKPRLPVIMFSRFTKSGANATIEALFLGADDYVPKPESRDGLTKCVQEELLPRIHQLGERDGWNSGRTTASTSASAIDSPASNTPSSNKPTATPRDVEITIRPETMPPRREETASVEVVVIAASTGGPSVLANLLRKIGPDLTVPVLIVQHMPANFTTVFAQRLAEKSQLDVREAKENQALSSAQVWIAPGDYHMFLSGNSNNPRVQLNQGMPENACRPAANVLFRSAAAVFGPAVLGVVLTGMGNDALDGSQSIFEAGGRILGQDEASSTVWGMPSRVAKAGITDAVLPPDELAKEISFRLTRKR